MRNKIYICGTGNVATALLLELRRHRVDVAGIFSRGNTSPDDTVPALRYGEAIPEKNSIVFIAVPDRYIIETEKALGGSGYATVHSAGSVGLNELKSDIRGVFYPLQSFSRLMATSWENLPVLIESNDEVLLESLFEIAAAFGTKPIEVDSEQREAIHLAAVFANNFGNAMFLIAQDLVEKAGLSPSILNPLIFQTAGKLRMMNARQAQTGPARRGDARVIAEHLKVLHDDPQLAGIYEGISKYLMTLYKS